MRFLIAGFGSIGRRHFRNLLALGQTDIIFLRSNKSTLDTDELDGFIVETDLEKALLHKPEAVILANPTSLHLDVAIPAAKAGCHLFFEKPISRINGKDSRSSRCYRNWRRKSGYRIPIPISSRDSKNQKNVK